MNNLQSLTQPEKKKSKSKGKKKMPNDDSLVENQTYHEVTEEAQPEKTKKKQKNVKENLGVFSLSNEVLEVHEVGDGEDSRLRGDNSNQQVKKKNKSEKCKEVVENAQPVKDKKREKKGDVGAGDSGRNRDRGSKKRKEKSFGCNTEEDINAGVLENSKKNGTAEHTDNSNHNKKLKDKKRKKKDDVGAGDSGKNRDRGSKKRKEKSLGCNTEEDINAGVLENSKKNGTAEPTDNSNHNKKLKDKKRKKDDVGAGDGGKIRDRGSKKRKEKSLGCNTEEDINAGVLENSKKNETAEPTDNSNHNKKLKDKKRKKKDDVGAGDSGKNRDRGSKKRKEKSLGCNTEEDINAGVLENSKKDETADPTDNSNCNKKSKKVKFSDNVEVFPITDTPSKGKKKKLDDGSKEKDDLEDGVIHGKRFSKEDDDIIQDAVYKYIEDHRLGEQGLEMILNCKSHPEVRHCWKEIGEALPWRHYRAVYWRAHVLFERSEARKWTPEEIELLKKFYEKHGPDWKTLSNELGKHRFHVKDTWRRIRYPNLKKGRWTQEEYQNLFNLVNLDLSMKVFEEKKTKHGMLRDNICWEAVGEKLSTRTNSVCCTKWLLIALVDLDATCEEDVDWDYLLEHRSGDVCRKRWNEMVRHIGENGVKPFSEQVEILSQRYCPDILEAREIYDNKVPVDL
ncbi:RNA polymerase I termination factor-like isoform X2 [Beta vulgaris subsp. vulgaris]|uniref:RNA polymerase I termination factor-like isoform X2 n=1 Tax=Beta vulgaris subsp. vulgaris TaxID=3555 RepID=UPI002547B8A9|nr:RNA polymerase I termination factor-like isoform X2 [Beta vulgaris subsp. vulgaris]